VAPPLEPVMTVPQVIVPQAAAVHEPAMPIPVMTDMGVLAPVERFQVETAHETTSWRVVVGPAVRFGRGSFEEFGNHLDLRPTRREAADDSTMLTLAQTLSRAGHLELRVGSEGLEAFCLGTHGVSVDGVALNRGERAALRESGECSLAQGAAVFSYRLLPGGDGAPTTVELRFSAGIGAGRRAYWVISELPSELIAVGVGAAVDLAPTPGGWQVTAKGDGVCLGEAPLPPGSTSLWTPDVPLVVAEGRTIVRA